MVSEYVPATGRLQMLLQRVLSEENMGPGIIEYRPRTFFVDNKIKVHFEPQENSATKSVGIGGGTRGDNFLKRFYGMAPLVDVARAAYPSDATAYLRLDEWEVSKYGEAMEWIKYKYKEIAVSNPVTTEYSPKKIGDESFDGMMKSVVTEFAKLAKQHPVDMLSQFRIPEKYDLLVNRGGSTDKKGSHSFLSFERGIDPRYDMTDAEKIPVYLKQIAFTGDGDSIGKLFKKLDETL